MYIEPNKIKELIDKYTVWDISKTLDAISEPKDAVEAMPERSLVRAIVNQAICDLLYNGYDAYKIFLEIKKLANDFNKNFNKIRKRFYRVYELKLEFDSAVSFMEGLDKDTITYNRYKEIKKYINKFLMIICSKCDTPHFFTFPMDVMIYEYDFSDDGRWFSILICYKNKEFKVYCPVCDHDRFSYSVFKLKNAISGRKKKISHVNFYL